MQNAAIEKHEKRYSGLPFQKTIVIRRVKNLLIRDVVVPKRLLRLFLYLSAGARKEAPRMTSILIVYILPRSRSLA